MSERFQVFISFKHLDGNGNETPDSHHAREIHRYFTDNDISAFLSTVSLEELGIAAYKKAIDDALDSARVLVAVGTSKQNLDSEWVRYEWDSFFNDILSGIKPEGRVFTYHHGVDLSSLPRALRQTQCIEHGPESLDRLYRFVAHALGRSVGAPARDADAGPAVQSSEDYVRVEDFLVTRQPLTSVSWLDAVEYAKGLTSGGLSGWQLPSIDQLWAIMETGLFEPARYHSSNQSGAKEAYYMNFESGRLNQAPKTYARAVNAIFVRQI